MSRARSYRFGPDVRLRVNGAVLARRHFEAEFGDGHDDAGDDADVEVEVSFGLRTRPEWGVGGGHKTARWRVSLGDPGDLPLRASVRIAGGPPSFALSLIQGYFVEPLVGVALARAGSVALPSAGLVEDGKALVLMGRSRSGKSSVSVRALAEGRPVLGDDQVVIGADGCCWPFPRRLRVYSDIRETAPIAWSRMPRSTRAALSARRATKWLSLGYVAPSLVLAPSKLGRVRRPSSLPAGRLVVVERATDVHQVVSRRRDVAWAVDAARDTLIDQRKVFMSAAGYSWQQELASVLDREARTLYEALAGLDVEHLRLPATWPARRAVDALDAHLRGIGVIP